MNARPLKLCRVRPRNARPLKLCRMCLRNAKPLNLCRMHQPAHCFFCRMMPQPVHCFSLGQPPQLHSVKDGNVSLFGSSSNSLHLEMPNFSSVAGNAPTFTRRSQYSILTHWRWGKTASSFLESVAVPTSPPTFSNVASIVGHSFISNTSRSSIPSIFNVSNWLNILMESRRHFKEQ